MVAVNESVRGRYPAWMPESVIADIEAVQWSARERRAWTPPEKMYPSQWAERNRVLTRRQSSVPGRWRQKNAPYLIIFDLPFKRPQIRKLNVKKMTQAGFSEGMRNVIGYAAAEEGDPALLHLPDEGTGRTIFADRILPLFDDTEVLRELQTDSSRDMKNTQVTLSNGFDLKLAWSGSAASLAANPIRFVFNDEVDKFALWSGREADPISLAEDRTDRYGNSLVLNVSSPTTRQGRIHELEEKSHIRLRWFVPCPSCGQYQQLVWDRLRWEKPWKEKGTGDRGQELEGEKKDTGEAPAPRGNNRFRDSQSKAKWIEAQAQTSTWYECENPACGFKIRDAHKPKMVAAGYWGVIDDKGKELTPAEGGYRLHADGREEVGPEGFPIGSEVGVQISALASLGAKHKFYLLAAGWIKCEGNPSELMNFYNSKLGEVFEHPTQTRTTNVFAQKCKRENGARPAKMLPTWASRVLMFVDTQKDHFWFVVRAFGTGRRSQRIHHGMVSTFEDLKAIFYQTYWPYPDNLYPPLPCHMLGIDPGGGTKTDLGGNRTDEVYRFCLTDPAWLKPIRGDKPNVQAIRTRQVTYRPIDQKRSPYDVMLHLIDVEQFQDILDSLIGLKLEIPDEKTGEVHEEEIWALNDLDDEEYNHQVASMHKVGVRSGKGKQGAMVERWIKKTEGAANHLRDCEKSILALAEISGTYLLPGPDVLARERSAQKAADEAMRGRGITAPDGRPYLITNR